jgi:hypothetical protein
MTNDIIALIANVALALSFIVALVFGIAQVKAAARDRRERLTLETLRDFQSHEFAGLMIFIMSNTMPATYEEWQRLPDNDKAMFLQFAQKMESLGMLVAEGFINTDLVDKTLGSFVNTAWGKYKTGFTDLRKELPDPFLGEYFQWLSERIEERIKKNPRKPFFESSRK